MHIYVCVCNRYFTRELLDIKTRNKHSKMSDYLDRDVGGLNFCGVRWSKPGAESADFWPNKFMFESN